MVNDIIADSLTRIRNASMRRLEVTTLYYAKIVVSVLEVFKTKGFIKDYKVNDKDGKQSIMVQLAYEGRGESELKRFKNGYGTIVVSTSKGVIANDEAYRENVGGEALCSIW